MGYKRAGFRVLGCVEIDPAINAIYRRNLHPAHNFLMDLREFNKIPDGDLPRELFALDVLDGSPPCSTFSMAGKRERAWGVEKRFREGQAKQTLDDLFFVFLETVGKLRPRVVVAENVTGLVKGNAKGYVNAIVARFRELGYAVQLFILNAAFMEVPQRRERVFFVARRLDALPPPNSPLKMEFNYTPLTFREVRSPQGLPLSADNGDINCRTRLLEKARPGDPNICAVNMRDRGRAASYTNALVWPGDTCPTVIASTPFYRMPDRTIFSAADCIAVGSFPQDYDLGTDDPHKAADMARYLVGMSVPPSMAAHVAWEVRRQWLNPGKIKENS